MRSVWSVLMVVLGLNFWALLTLGPLQLEGASQDTRVSVVLLYLSPLALLALGAFVRSRAVLLGVFPMLFIPIYLVLPEADRAVHESTAGFFSLAVSALMFAGVSAVWLDVAGPSRWHRWWVRAAHRGPAVPVRRPAEGLTLRPVEPPTLRRDLWWPYRRHFAPRVVALGALLVVPLWGLNFQDGVVEAYAAGFGAAALSARVLANLGWLFLWIVAAYLFFFSPSMNLELEQRQLDGGLDLYAERLARRRRTWVLPGMGVLAGLIGVALLAWRMG